MKKIFYILVLTVVTAVSLSACTEEVVKPNNIAGSGSGIKE